MLTSISVDIDILWIKIKVWFCRWRSTETHEYM